MHVQHAWMNRSTRLFLLILILTNAFHNFEPRFVRPTPGLTYNTYELIQKKQVKEKKIELFNFIDIFLIIDFNNQFLTILITKLRDPMVQNFLTISTHHIGIPIYVYLLRDEIVWRAEGKRIRSRRNRSLDIPSLRISFFSL